MASSWAFVGQFSAPAAALKRLRAALPRQKTAAEDILDSNVIHDRVYSTAGLTISRVGGSDEYKELLASIRSALMEIAKAGARGAGDLVGFVDSASKTGVHFEIVKGKVRESAIAARAVKAVQSSKPYLALAARHAKAFEDADTNDNDNESGMNVVNRPVRAALLAAIAKLTDAELIAAARATKLRVLKAAKEIPLHELYARPSGLRKALDKGGDDWCDDINRAPILILAQVDKIAALGFARRIIDEGSHRFDPLKPGALAVLGESRADEDFERLWRVFSAERAVQRRPAGTSELLRSNHPQVDARLFALFREELGAPPDYVLPWEERSRNVAWLLFRRGHAEAVRLIEEASRLHPWKHAFAFDPRLLNDREW